MINALIEKVLQGQYHYVKKEDGTLVFCAEGNQEKMGSGVYLAINTQSSPEAVLVYGSLAHSLAEPRLKYIRKRCDEDECIETEFGTIQIMDDSLIWVVALMKSAILTCDEPSFALNEVFKILLQGLKEKFQWAKENLFADDYEYLMLEHDDEGYNDRYSFFDQGEGMVFCAKYNTDAVYLINTNEEKVIQLVDEEGNMVAFTKDDVDESVIKLDVDSDNAANLKAHYRFFVYNYKNGQAEVEWTVMPDGRYFADEDGFGAENCSELIAVAIINKDGKLLKPFKPLPRFVK